MLKRATDIIISLTAIFLLSAPMLVIAILIKLTSPGPILFWSSRIGRDNSTFQMPKFRTMRADAPVVATHLFRDPKNYITPVGGFLRRTSIDEFPQLWSILIGHMSVVGPRPALYNQDDLITLRTEKNVHRLRPGLTGYAQINGRDEIPIPEKVALDEFYLNNQSFWLDLRIILETATQVFSPKNISH